MSLLPLPADESARLSYCEQTIAIGLKNFVDVGTALLEIQQHRLYRSTHATFAAYCKEQWGMSGRRSYQMIESAQIVGLLPFKSGEQPQIVVAENVNHGSQTESKPLPAPNNERSIRPLSKVPKEKVAETYQRAVEIAGGEAPTAAQTEQAVEELSEKEEPTVIVQDEAEEESEPEEDNEFLNREEDDREASPSTAMIHAQAAIEALSCISNEDPEWFKAFSKVRKFLNNLETEWEAE